MEGDSLTRAVAASLVLLDVLLLLTLSGALEQEPVSQAICLACIFTHAFLSLRWARRRIAEGDAKPFEVGFKIGFPAFLVIITPVGWLGLVPRGAEPMGFAGLAALGVVMALVIIVLVCLAAGALGGTFAVLLHDGWRRIDRGDANAHLRVGAVVFLGWFLAALELLRLDKWPGTVEAWPPLPLAKAMLTVSWYVALVASGLALLWSLVAIVTRRGGAR